ncbi:two-component system sensor histidine kinase TctE [Plasticicumulans lactativorans]|uniref:histidine kinase n=1 Tax=Plasticicumulans lactativorans TaxID=1133106 RepID=A0A4R2KSN9_9GAMM|nr:sensor histidine kinase [Plasticicumulans lactativorans]TCO75757.1 two-component system sensor histidine kinase TctE [Plasticicumulans lactativorans]
MRRADWSIRRRLLVWLLTPLLAVCALLLAANHVQARRTADDTYDRLLRASLLAIADRVSVVDGHIEVDLPGVALEMLASAGQDRVYYRVDGPVGRFVTGYADLPTALTGTDGAPRFHDAEFRGEAVRIAALARPLAPWGLDGLFEVQLAQTRGERDRLARELVFASALRLLLVVVVATAITALGVKAGLAPLTELRRALRRRSPGDLAPITQPAPPEVRELVSAINQLMQRLEASFEAMRRFIADASHQLRTPLAGLQTQAELTLRETEPEALARGLQRLLDTTRRTSRLANQLLSLARAEPGGGVAEHATFDLAALAADLTREIVPAALLLHIDLGFEGDGPLPVTGDELLLREMLKNLIDNAMRYCPAGSTVTVRTQANARGVRLEVEDDGPGIAPAERARVLERFYRIPGSASDGSGLGLAIVHEVAERHGATLTLADGVGGRGLCVRLDFARAAG